jgi:8-oxo-dGTP pyrophosphatase MutT (NUDIX family)
MNKIYEWIKDCYYRVSAKGIIKNNEWKILFVQEDTGLWDIPGGWVDHWEELKEALKREIYEEMWLEVITINEEIFHISLTESSGIWSPKRPICLIFREITVKNLDFTPSSECQICFCSPKEALEKLDLYYPNIKVIQELIQKEEA